MNTQRGENGCVEGLDGAEEASNPPAAETELPPAKRSKYYSEKATEYALTQSTCQHCGVTGRGPVMHRHHHDRCKHRPQP